MRIDSKVGGVVAVADSREVKPATAKPDKSPASVVKLSSAATQASQESDDVAPPQRTRLDEIRAAIRQDKYPIDLDKLASKMVDDEFVLGNHGHKVS